MAVAATAQEAAELAARGIAVLVVPKKSKEAPRADR